MTGRGGLCWPLAVLQFPCLIRVIRWLNLLFLMKKEDEPRMTQMGTDKTRQEDLPAACGFERNTILSLA